VRSQASGDNGDHLVWPIPALMLVSAGWLALCGSVSLAWTGGQQPTQLEEDRGGCALGGSMWAGIRAVAASPYLLGICAYLFLLTMSATVLYMEQTALVGREIPTPKRVLVCLQGWICS